ncbi:hypothetical protein EJ05DRAFT_434941 [Pseudovirgaria hyperparasitica]|uniref:Aminoglycoside phosphotransferase domain-containing protein n=1 Tax=Pseudovirgaria hyperparasitica TaxID=470096 RepID=A0A6A6WEF2_9PEZI|nr:uncharacterized protein EJ05DRAFT_434941 [Pseudovirgaria hyperparasitica]KAF2760915.1 hypothetical protein EJ05DRAFT_434941 [Pseudovirgaria hyperparasitica]
MVIRSIPIRLSRNLSRSPLPRCCRLFVSCATDIEITEKDCELFEYTSGRWIFNEHLRLAERQLSFNVKELQKAAAESVNQPFSEVRSFRKFAEGGFNRVFEICMRDGTSVLARLPYPLTLPRRLAVASEVATLDFIRSYGIPTPRVLDYCVEINPVGSEYMIMERVSGTAIGDSWFDLSEKERLKVLLQIVELEAKLFALQLPASGSIYYARDLSPNCPKIYIPNSDGQLCIGPYAGESWWFGERGDLDIDRGPHTHPSHVLEAPAKKELAWIRAYGRPRYPFDRAYRGVFDYKKQDPKEHAKSLETYIRLAPYLVPPTSELNSPILRHPDLQPHNIFVSESFDVTGLIDWQHSMVLPTFLVSGIPNSFQNYKDKESLTFIPPRLPDDIEIMDMNERDRALEQFRRRHVHFYYLGFTQRSNELHWQAIQQEPSLLKRRIFNDAGNPWEGLNLTLQMDFVRILESWDKVPAPRSDGALPACPIVLEKQEIQKLIAQDELLREADAEMEGINELLGVASDGWVSNENFEIAKGTSESCRGQAFDAVADDPVEMEMTERHWPFDDWNEDE